MPGGPADAQEQQDGSAGSIPENQPQDQAYKDTGSGSAASQRDADDSTAEETTPQQAAPQPDEQVSEGEAQQAPQEQAPEYRYAAVGGEDGEQGPILFALSHVADGCLNTIGVCNTSLGYMPIASSVKLPPSFHGEGPVDGSVITPSLALALEKTTSVLYRKAKQEEQSVAAADIVDRARQGDQNAMAIISLVRKNAPKNTLARKAYDIMKRYIDENPADAQMGYEASSTKAPDVKDWARVWLANGPEITTDRLREFATSFGNEDDRGKFLYGCIKHRSMGNSQELNRKFDPETCRLMEIGRTIGRAHALQKLRQPGSRISDYCPVIGWELGE